MATGVNTNITNVIHKTSLREQYIFFLLFGTIVTFEPYELTQVINFTNFTGDEQELVSFCMHM